MTSHRFSLLLLLSNFLIFVCAKDGGDVSDLCRNQKSCGTCQTTHPSCNWCIDPEFSGSYRCDVSSALLRHGCREELIYSVRPEVKLAENVPLGTLKPDQTSIVQLQPQAVDIKTKPGEKAEFQISYLHASSDPTDAHMLNSVTESNKFRIHYHVKCKDVVEETNVCRDVRNNEVVVFNVTVEVEECTNENRGGAYVSVGVAGYQDITAVLIVPICGCDCEDLSAQEQQSGYCNNRGNHVCGECVCEKAFSGKQCETEGAPSPPIDTNDIDDTTDDSSQSGCDKTSDQSDAQCRQSSDKEVCSGRGSCNCGTCTCNHDLLEGQFCECDNSACPVAGRILCSGHGKCECGVCRCDSDWARTDCSCSTSAETCKQEEGEQVCGGHGLCECGGCLCDEGFSGRFCENCLTCTEAPETDSPTSSEEKVETSPTEEDVTASETPAEGDKTATEDNKIDGNEGAEAEGTDQPKAQVEAKPEPTAEKTSSAVVPQLNILLGLVAFVAVQVCSTLRR